MLFSPQNPWLIPVNSGQDLRMNQNHSGGWACSMNKQASCTWSEEQKVEIEDEFVVTEDKL